MIAISELTLFATRVSYAIALGKECFDGSRKQEPRTRNSPRGDLQEAALRLHGREGRRRDRLQIGGRQDLQEPLLRWKLTDGREGRERLEVLGPGGRSQTG